MEVSGWMLGRSGLACGTPCGGRGLQDPVPITGHGRGTVGFEGVANHDRQVLSGDFTGSDEFARQSLSDRHVEWLATLPGTLSLCEGEVFACHGSPGGGDLDYLLEDVSSGRQALASSNYVRPRLDGIGTARLVLCGHTHTPRAVLVDEVLVVNPGSVGMPAYADAHPVPHVIENGSPHARYASLTRSGGSWSIDFRAVEYDWDAAALQARRNGRPNVAVWTATGRTSG